MTKKIYVRYPERSNKKGSIIQIFADMDNVYVDGKIVSLIDGATSIHATTDKYIRIHNNDEVVNIRLNPLESKKIGWLWLTQPQYRPDSKIQGFFAVRERMNTYMNVLRKCDSKKGSIKFCKKEGTSHYTTIHEKEIDPTKLVETFEFDISEHQDEGEYKIDLLVNGEPIATQELEICHFKKEGIVINTQSPSWIIIGDSYDISLHASYQHGELVKKGKACIEFNDGVKKEVDVIHGNAKASFDVDDKGAYTINITIKDEQGEVGNSITFLTVTDEPIQFNVMVPSSDNMVSHLPVKIPCIITNPLHIPLPDHHASVKIIRNGTIDNEVIENTGYITDENGRITIERIFEKYGDYELNISSEYNNEKVECVTHFTIQRHSHQKAKVIVKLDKKMYHEGDDISGKITIHGQHEELKQLRKCLLSLQTDHILDSQAIVICDYIKQDTEQFAIEIPFTFEGIVDYYGKFIVEACISTMNEGKFLISNVENNVELPYSPNVKIIIDSPSKVSTGCEIQCNVTIDGLRLQEEFKIFGALVDRRVLLSHVDTNIGKTFLKPLKSLCIKEDVSETRKPLSRPPQPMMHNPPSFGSSMNTKLFGTRMTSSVTRRSTSYSSQNNGYGALGGLRDEMLDELDRLKNFMGDSDLECHSLGSSSLEEWDTLIEKILRENFAESVLIEPKIIHNGSCNFTLTAPDSITTYDLIIFGLGEKQFGVTTHPIVVCNPIFTSIGNPSRVVYGDEFEITITAHNTTDKPLEGVMFGLDRMEGLTLVSKTTEWKVNMNAKETVTKSIRVKANGVGYANASFILLHETMIEMNHFDHPLYVKPPNSPCIQTIRGNVHGASQTMEFDWNIEKETVHALGIVNALPKMEMGIIDGWQSLIQYPHGCCEQTCSSTLPNVVVYEYLNGRNLLTSELKKTLLRHMYDGYETLVSYHNDDGGFSYWGGESSPFYTALALSVIGQLKPYINVNDSIIQSALSYVNSLKQDDHWSSYSFKNGHSRVAPTDLSDYGLTAFILHSLSQLNVVDSDAFTWLFDHLDDIETNASVLGMMMEMMCKHSDYQSIRNMGIRELWACLKGCGVEEGDVYYWKNSDALTGTKGKPSIESTAYAIIGLSLAQNHGISCFDILQKSIDFIMSKRNVNGWGSTRDTLYASLAISKAGSNVNSNFTLNVNVNGNTTHTYEITPSNVDYKVHELRQMFIDDLKCGKNHVSITMDGKGTIPITAELKTWNVHGFGSHETDMAKINVTLDGDDDPILNIQLTPLQKNIRSVMIEQPIPSFVKLTDEEIERMEEEFSDICDHFEIVHDSFCFFFEEVNHETTIQLVLPPSFKGKFTIESAKAYQMYDPHNEVVSTPIEKVIL